MIAWKTLHIRPCGYDSESSILLLASLKVADGVFDGLFQLGINVAATVSDLADHCLTFLSESQAVLDCLLKHTALAATHPRHAWYHLGEIVILLANVVSAFLLGK